MFGGSADGEKAGIGQLLREYGLIAVMFHFSVWVLSLTSVFTLLSTGVDLDALLASVPLFSEAAEGGSEGGGAVGVAGRAAATLAIVEAVGPIRLALTVAVTPRISGAARQIEAVRDAEAMVARTIDSVLARGR